MGIRRYRLANYISFNYRKIELDNDVGCLSVICFLFSIT